MSRRVPASDYYGGSAGDESTISQIADEIHNPLPIQKVKIDNEPSVPGAPGPYSAVTTAAALPAIC